MKKILFLLVLIFSCSFANAQTCKWAQRFVDGIVVTDNATDKNGNIYTVGAYASHMNVYNPDTFNLNNGVYLYIDSSYENGYFAKFDSNHKCLWAKTIVGSYYNGVYNLSFDVNGNICVVGTYDSPSLKFDENISIINTATDSLYMMDDTFIAKYDTCGNCLWARNIGGIYHDKSQGIAIDSKNNIYVQGAFKSPLLNFSNGIFLTKDDNWDNNIFLAKYDSSGNCLWARKIDCKSDEFRKSLSIDKNGNIYVIGNFYSPEIKFSDSISLTNAGAYDCFISKYNTQGDCLWARQFGDTTDDKISSSVVDSNCNVFVAGFFDSPPNKYLFDGFIAKYDSNGQSQWLQRISGDGNDAVEFMKTDQKGNLFISGTFKSSILNFNNNISLSGPDISDDVNLRDIFLAQYDISGSCKWARKIWGNNNDAVTSLCCDINSNIFIAGYSESAFLYFNNRDSLAKSDRDVFYYIAKYTQDLTGVQEIRTYSLSAYPNPASSETYVNYTIQKYGDCSINIYNCLGELVKVIFQGKKEEGSYSDRIDLKELASGSYRIVINAGNEIQTASIALVK